MCVTYLHTKDNMADKFIADTKASVEKIMENPEKPVEGKVAHFAVSCFSIYSTKCLKT